MNLLVLGLLAGLGQGMGLLFFNKSMTLENISLISPIFSTYALLTVFYGIFFLHEPITLLRVVAVVSIFTGTFLASTDLSFSKQKINFFQSRGLRIALLGTLFMAFGFLFITIVFKKGDYYFYNMVWGFSTFITVFVFNSKTLIKFKLPSKNIFLVLICVGFLYGTGNLSYANSLNFIPSSIASAVSGIFPAITVLCGLTILKEKLKLNQWMGIILIVLGLVIIPL